MGFTHLQRAGQSGEGPQAGFQCLNQQISTRMAKVLSTIVGRMLGRSPDDEETLIRTMCLSGQMHVFHFARKTVLAKLNWDTIDANRLALLKRVIRENISTLLRAMVKTRDSAGSTVHTMHARRAVSRTKKKQAAAGRPPG